MAMLLCSGVWKIYHSHHVSRSDHEAVWIIRRSEWASKWPRWSHGNHGTSYLSLKLTRKVSSLPYSFNRHSSSSDSPELSRNTVRTAPIEFCPDISLPKSPVFSEVADSFMLTQDTKEISWDQCHFEMFNFYFVPLPNNLYRVEYLYASFLFSVLMGPKA